MFSRQFLLLLTVFLLLAAAHSSTASTVDFEDLSLAPSSFYNGADNAGGFTSTGVHFSNSFTDWGGGFTSWSGFAYSNTTDTTTPGFINQYSAFTGGGAGGSANYSVAFGAAVITLPAPTLIQSVQFTNTTYAALSMLNGDAFAKKFGGATGDDLDFFLLKILGFDAADSPTGSVDFYLADYRFNDNAQDYVVNAWTSVDLSSLGDAVKTLQFELFSSDVGGFGINTPTYFALDNLVTPEPTSLVLMGIMGGLMLMRRKRQR